MLIPYSTKSNKKSITQKVAVVLRGSGISPPLDYNSKLHTKLYSRQSLVRHSGALWMPIHTGTMKDLKRPSKNNHNYRLLVERGPAGATSQEMKKGLPLHINKMAQRMSENLIEDNQEMIDKLIAQAVQSAVIVDEATHA